MVLLYVLLGLANLLWLSLLIQALTALNRLAILPEEGQPVSKPLVTVLVPARNESRILSQTLDSLFRQDYTNIEIIVIDDHSEDGTFELATSISKQDSRLRVMRSADLPPDWRGKSWALHQGAASARGNWILLTDADVIHEPFSVRAAVAEAQHEKLDLLSVMPHLECKTFWDRVILPAFALILTIIRPMYKSNDPKSRVALAAGGFILVKTLLLKHVDGFHLIRESVAEDVKLAELFKNSGYRIRTYVAKNPVISTRMYLSFGDMWEGLSRHAFEGAGYNPVRMIAAIVAGYALMVAPPIFLLAGIVLHSPFVILLSIFPVIVMTGAQRAACRQFRVPFIYCVTFPLAVAVYGLMMINSMLSYYFRGGNLWKGRRYS